MGLLDLIPVVIGAGIILKTTEVVMERPRPISIHERARRKVEKVV